MGLLGLIIASIVNIFLHNSVMDTIISFLGVLIFTGLTAYDVQKIKRLATDLSAEGEEENKIALLGALTLYLDFVNLFLYLLSLLGKKKK
jgi:FtsH-binding integral membrane protein